MKAATPPIALRKFKHGSKTDQDPEHMHVITTATTVRDWLDTLHSEKDATAHVAKVPGRPKRFIPKYVPRLFTEWELSFIELMHSLLRNTRKDVQPFTGKQLVMLHDLITKLADDTASRIAQGAK